MVSDQERGWGPARTGGESVKLLEGQQAVHAVHTKCWGKFMKWISTKSLVVGGNIAREIGAAYCKRSILARLARLSRQNDCGIATKS